MTLLRFFVYNEASIHFEWWLRTEFINILLLLGRCHIFHQAFIYDLLMCIFINSSISETLIIISANYSSISCQTHNGRPIDCFIKLWHEPIPIHWWSWIWIIAIAHWILIVCSMGTMLHPRFINHCWNIWIIHVNSSFIWLVEFALICIAANSFAHLGIKEIMYRDAGLLLLLLTFPTHIVWLWISQLCNLA